MSSVGIAYFSTLFGSWDCEFLSHGLSFKDNVLSDNQHAGKRNLGGQGY